MWLFHRHTWSIISAQEYNHKSGGTIYRHTTKVLTTCVTCGKFETQEIDGHFAQEIVEASKAADRSKNIGDIMKRLG